MLLVLGLNHNVWLNYQELFFFISSSLQGSKVESVIPEKVHKSGAGGLTLSKQDLILLILSVKNSEKLLAFSKSEASGSGDDFLPNKKLTVENNSLQVFNCL